MKCLQIKSPNLIPILLISVLGILNSIRFLESKPDDDQSIQYTIPNPFEKSSNEDKNGYYYIKSIQTILSGKHFKTQFEVEDYFTPRGLSFSLHRARDDKKNNFALVADGPGGNSYVVSNFDSADKFECELDHLHHHHEIFPWQFFFDVEDPEEAGGDVEWTRRSKRNRKQSSDSANKWAKRRYFYGVGAIWFNAIQRQITTTEIGDKSAYPGSNMWQLKEGDVTINFMFDKPEDPRQAREAVDMQKLLDKSQLGSIQIGRQQVILRDNKSTHVDTQYENIYIKEFKRQVEVLPLFKVMIQECREHSIKHRIFPSLIEAISISPKRMFKIDYVERRYHWSLLPNEKVNQSSKEEHRDSKLIQYKMEWFSFKHEAQVNIYQNLDSNLASSSNDNHDHQSTIDNRVDVFMKKFTELETPASKVTNNKTITMANEHRTAHFHYIKEEDEIVECHVGEHEPLLKDHLMNRIVHFNRFNGENISGRLTGLGALIMNVADMGYKKFDLFKRRITVQFDPFDPEARVEHEVNGWEFFDMKTKHSIHFYFNARKNHYEQTTIEDLIRVDIRDALFVDINDSLDADANYDDSYEADLIARYDIIDITFDVLSSELDLIFKTPRICLENPTPSEDGVNNNDYDIDDNPIDDSKDNTTYMDEDFYNQFNDDDLETNYDSDDEDNNNNGNDGGGEHFLIDGKDFEFIPGREAEIGQVFPNFYEYLDGQPAYTIVSKIQIIEDNEQASKHIHFVEHVDLESELAHFTIYHSDKSQMDNKPENEFYVNYNSELVFKLTSIEGDIADRKSCQVVDDVEPWMRVFSAPLKYYKIPSNSGLDPSRRLDPHESQGLATVLSSKIPIYGLGALWRRASESDQVEFLGIERNIIIGADDRKFKRVRWILSEDNDFTLTFQFLLDVNKWEERSDLSAHDKIHRHFFGRRYELLKLDSVFVSKLEKWNALNEKTYFKKFKITWPQVEISLQSDAIDKLPGECRKALLDHLMKTKANDDEYYKQLTNIPSFTDFIKATNVYTMSYDVISHLSHNQTVIVQPVQSIFDRKSGRGLIKIQPGPGEKESRELYITDSVGYMFYPDGRTCKRIDQINPLLSLSPVGKIFNINESGFGKQKTFGLALIWQIMSNFKTNRVYVARRPDERGNPLEIRYYYFNLDFFPKKVKYQVVFTFSQQSPINDRVDFWFPGTAKTKKEPEFKLERVEFIPRNIGNQEAIASSSTHQIDVNIRSMHSVLSDLDGEDLLKLPSECVDVPPSPVEPMNPIGPEVPRPTANLNAADHFPRIMELIKGSNQFHMRSEVVSSVGDTIPLTDRIYLMDEWLDHKNIRLRTFGLREKNLDLLIYGQTREIFDLSTNYKCVIVAPQLYSEASMSERQGKAGILIDFWSKDDVMPENLAQLYYSPLSLWYIAEKNLNNVKLANSVDLSPESIGGLNSEDKLNREMRTETWRVESPAGEYDLTFEKLSTPEEEPHHREWHVLRKVIIPKTEYLGIKRTIEIDVINYRYDHTDKEMLQNFLLPEGYNCPRNSTPELKDIRSYDELNLNIANSEVVSFWYEASLEMIEEKAVVQREDESNYKYIDEGEFDFDHKKHVLPTLLGHYISTGGGYTTGSGPKISSDYSKVRFLNGTLQSTKLVYDSSTRLMWQLDLKTGSCQQAKVQSQEFWWTLNFPLAFQENKFVSITLNDKLFEKLFLFNEKNNFQPLNWYNVNGISTSTYERAFDKLKIMNELFGPVTIIRKYQHHEQKVPPMRDINNTGRKTMLHDSVHSKVLIFDDKRQKVLAILRVRISQADSNSLHLRDLLKASTNTIEQCYNDGDKNWDRQVRKFAIEYTIPTGYFIWTYTHIADIEEEFIRKILLKEGRLMMLQLDGNIRAVFSSTTNRLVIYFSLLEGPSAIEYFADHQGYEMNEKLEPEAEVRVTGSILECSTWCDKLNCVAMSYCTDHTCKVVSTQSLKASNKELLSNPSVNQACSYFNKPGDSNFRSLDSFSSSLNLMINEARATLDTYSLHIGNKLVQPTYFRELRKDFLFAEEDQDAPNLSRNEQALPGSDDEERENEHYRVLERGVALDVWKLTDLMSSIKPIGSLRMVVDHAANYVRCFESCRRHNCMLMSFSNKDSSCQVVSGSPEHFQKVLAIPRPISLGSVVTVRDYLKEYIKFEFVERPRKFVRELKGLSPLQCAAICKATDEDEEDNKLTKNQDKSVCLSFDHCEKSNACYLQDMHVMMDSFEQSLLGMNLDLEGINKTGNSGKELCNHYSRHLIADFKRIPSKRFVRRQSNISRRVRGENSEKCALECHQDEECLGFEYCFNERLTPTQSCLFASSFQATSQKSNSTEYTPATSKEFMKEKLKFSRSCNVYMLRHAPEKLEVDSISGMISPVIGYASRFVVEHSSGIYYLFSGLGYIFSFFVIGVIIQFVYTRVFGSGLLFNKF